MKKLYIAAAAIIFAVGCGKAPADPFAGEWIDLTHNFDEKTVYWVTAEPFKRTTVAEGTTDKGFYYSAYNFSGAEHGGTHLDSPIHFAEGKKTADQIELNELIGPGVKIDVAAKAEADRDYLISTDDIKAWEAANGQITIWVHLAGPWEFEDVFENLKVQDYATAPSGNPAPGLFAHKMTCHPEESSCSMTVPANNFYGVHVNVGQWVPCYP